MIRTRIPWADLEVLGGRQEGDPPADEWFCVVCSRSRQIDGPDCAALSCEHRGYGGHDITLPESGALVIRILFRQITATRRNRRLVYRGSEDTTLPLLEVPCFTLIGKSLPVSERFWAFTDLREGWAGGSWARLGHGDILDPCEALAAIVRDEAERVRKADSQDKETG